MTRLWLLQQSVPGLKLQMGVADRSARRSLVENIADLFLQGGGSGAAVRPRLAIDDEAFTLDLFEEGLTFVSERLVQAMALSADTADFGEVDDSGCSAAVRGMGYRTLRPKCHADALDHELSDGEIVSWVNADGSIKTDWLLAIPEPNTPPPRAQWRKDFQPPADLFIVNGTPWRATTDALAVRVTAIGPAGIDFVDPIASAATGDLSVRTAR